MKTCVKCGCQYLDGIFCPECGYKYDPDEVKEVEERLAKEKEEQERLAKEKEEQERFSKEAESVEKKRPAKEKKKKKGKIIALVIVVIIVIIAIPMILSSGSDGDDETSAKAAGFCEEVQNGYLGNYDTVTLQTVMEEVYPDGDWNYGTSNDGTYYIVEYTEGDEIDIQFTVYDDGSETFSVSGFDMPYDTDTESYSEEDVATMLNAMYYAYADAKACGISVDGIDLYDTSVLSGHFGPIQSVVYSEDTSIDTEEAVSESEDINAEDTSEEESELAEEAENSADEPIDIVYGVYEYDNGTDNVMTAEVGFASDSDADYIYIDALGYGGHYTVNYAGTLYEQISDGSYPSDNEWSETRIYVYFYEGGMRVQVSSTDDENDYVLDGYYTLTEELDLDQVS